MRMRRNGIEIEEVRKTKQFTLKEFLVIAKVNCTGHAFQREPFCKCSIRIPAQNEQLKVATECR